MAWRIEFTDRALRQMKALDPQMKRQVFRYLQERIVGDEDPRRFGKALTGDLLGLWRYRVGDHRVVCQLKDAELLVLVLKVAHRRSVYDE